MQQPTSRHLGGLDTLEVAGADDGLVVVMCHGFGADASDLYPLAHVVQAPAGTGWLFPNAPIQVPIGPHMLGRAWFPIDMEALQMAMMAGTHRDMAGESPPQLARACTMLQAMLDEHGTPLHRVVFAGFSQGAMLATAATLNAPNNPAGLAILSGTLLDAGNWRQLAAKRAGLRFFQSHGRRDPLLDVAAARRLHALLTEAGLQGELLEFAGEHEIPMPVLDRFGAYLRGLRPLLH